MSPLFILSCLNLCCASSNTDADVNFHLYFFVNSFQRSSSSLRLGSLPTSSTNSLSIRDIQSVTFSPRIFPRHRAMRLNGLWNALLFSFCIHQRIKSLMKSIALSLSPSNLAGPSPFKAPSVVVVVVGAGIEWLCSPVGRVQWIGAKDLA